MANRFVVCTAKCGETNFRIKLYTSWPKDQIQKSPDIPIALATDCPLMSVKTTSSQRSLHPRRSQCCTGTSPSCQSSLHKSNPSHRADRMNVMLHILQGTKCRHERAKSEQAAQKKSPCRFASPVAYLHQV